MLIISLILVQVVIFVGLLVILRRILTQNIVVATRHLDELNRDYTKKEEEANRILEEAQAKARDTLDKVKEEAEAQKGQLIKEANIESDNILKRSHAKSEEIIQQADRARQLLLEEINEKIAAEAIEKASELIQHALPDKFRNQVHSYWFEELMEKELVQLDSLTIPRDAQEVSIISAVGMNEEQRRILFKKIKNIIGHDVRIKEEVNPAILAGVVVNIGNLVLDGSLRNKIKEHARSFKYAADK